MHEALAAAEICGKKGIAVKVIDMPSVDEELLMTLYRTGLPMIFAEQNNGYLRAKLLKVLYRHKGDMDGKGMSQISTINTLDQEGTSNLSTRHLTRSWLRYFN